MAADVKIVGLQKLGETLDLFTQDVQRKMIRKAASAGIEVFRREIRAKAPVRVEVGITGFRNTAKGKKQRQPGYLKKHIGRWSKVRSGESYSVMTGPTPSAFYAKFYELGTSHQPARPFMRPAFDSKNSEAQRVFADTLNQQIVERLK
jgi:HK97 gp10 family phage protein